jgi:HlyD family secretion protein
MHRVGEAPSRAVLDRETGHGAPMVRPDDTKRRWTGPVLPVTIVDVNGSVGRPSMSGVVIRSRARPSPDDSYIPDSSRPAKAPNNEPRSAMRRVILTPSAITPRPPVFLVLLLIALAAPGCHDKTENHYISVSEPPTVRVIEPQVKDLVRVVGQPSFIEAYERTSIYPKLAGYIQEWKVDIGDKVKKDQVLATLFIPELLESHGTKGATVVLDRERIVLADQVVEVAVADVKAAGARVEEAQAEVAQYRADVDRWESEVKRLQREVDQGVVDPQVLLESTNQLRSKTASWDAAKATVLKTQAELLSREATLSKARVDVKVAQADLSVADSEEKRMKALVGYMTLFAPFPGVIVARNANTFDFVLPTTGDPTADPRGPYLSPGGGAAPVYVVDRTDVVRIFVDIPEKDANYVHIGSRASVLVRAYRDQPITGSVTRTSWALNIKSRTLRAEVDLPNTGTQVLPGMYAYAKVIIDRPGVLAVPLSALSYVGEKTFYWTLEDGKAKRVEVQTGITGDRDPKSTEGQWIEVTNRQLPPSSGGAEQWVPIDGKEQVLLGDLSILAEGTPVEVAKAEQGTKVASEESAAERRPVESHPSPQ